MTKAVSCTLSTKKFYCYPIGKTGIRREIMKYSVKIILTNGEIEAFIVYATDCEDAIEKSNEMFMENYGYWFNSSYVYCYIVDQI